VLSSRKTVRCCDCCNATSPGRRYGSATACTRWRSRSGPTRRAAESAHPGEPGTPPGWSGRPPDVPQPAARRPPRPPGHPPSRSSPVPAHHVLQRDRYRNPRSPSRRSRVAVHSSLTCPGLPGQASACRTADCDLAITDRSLRCSRGTAGSDLAQTSARRISPGARRYPLEPEPRAASPEPRAASREPAYTTRGSAWTATPRSG